MEYKCCICGETHTGYGNNPWPVVKEDDAKCCDRCNENIVIPERICLVMGYNRGTEQSK